MTLLSELVLSLPLLAEDRGKLHARGFTDDVIAKYHFKSCYDGITTKLRELESRHGQDLMIYEQLYTVHPRYRADVHVNGQLTTPNILIPYIDEQGNVVKVRPHKMGFKDQPPLVYRTDSSRKKHKSCIIAESEFKAVAAECFGFASIGIPGIASMSGKHLEYFMSVISSIPADEFVICFDNEIKNDPAFSNYKSDWRKRYDTILYAYVMCKKIIDMNIHCKIAVLPAEWMVDGKIDIDTALAQGRTATEFAAMVDQAMANEMFLNKAGVDPLHRSYIERRKKMFFNKSPIFVENNCFHINKPTKDDKPAEKIKLMNGHIRIKNSYEGDDGNGSNVFRQMVIIGEYGEESKPYDMPTDKMSSKKYFSQWLMGHGNYIYYGDDRQLTLMWEWIFDNDEGGIINIVYNCGYVKEFDFWIFDNVLIKNGVQYDIDDNGIFWIDAIGYKPTSLSDQTPVPSLSKDTFDIDKFTTQLADTVDIKEPGMAKAMMAWFIATLFCDVIQQKFHMFPLFFLYGDKGSGKSTIVRWMLNLIGMADNMHNLASSSIVGISRVLGYYSNLPMVVDDWRDVQEMKKFIPYFLGVYNRQTSIKGVKAARGIQQYDLRATLAILGEEIVSDAGLSSRCLQFYMPMKRRKECYDEVEATLPEASGYTRKLLSNGYDKHADNILTAISIAKKDLAEFNPELESRIIFNYAVIKGVWHEMFGPDAELGEYINARLVTGQAETTKTSKLSKFASEFIFGVRQKILNADHYSFSSDGREVWLWLSGVIDVMNRQYNRTTNPVNADLILKHLTQQDYFISSGWESLGGGSVQVIKLNLLAMPDEMRRNFKGADMFGGFK